MKSQRGSGIVTVQMLEEFPWMSPKILISPTRPQHKDHLKILFSQTFQLIPARAGSLEYGLYERLPLPSLLYSSYKALKIDLLVESIAAFIVRMTSGCTTSSIA